MEESRANQSRRSVRGVGQRGRLQGVLELRDILAKVSFSAVTPKHSKNLVDCSHAGFPGARRVCEKKRPAAAKADKKHTAPSTRNAPCQPNETEIRAMLSPARMPPI